jgi:hypothetical protein
MMTDEKPRRVVDEDEFEAPSGGDKVISMTESQLRELIRQVQAEGGGVGLPPGAYRDADGVVYHDVLEPTGRTRTNQVTGAVEQVNRVVPRRVYLVLDPSPEGLRTARRACTASGLDWYHPRLGWHLYGTKRQVDAPENLGAGAEVFRMAYAPMPTEDDDGDAVTTMQGIDAEDAAASPPDDGSDLEAAPVAAARPRRQKGHDHASV